MQIWEWNNIRCMKTFIACTWRRVRTPGVVPEFPTLGEA